MSCHEELPSGLGWHLCPRGWPGLGWRALGLHAARCLPGQCRWCTLPLRLSASREHSQTGGMAVICSQHCCGAERLFQSQHFTGSSVPRQYRTLQNIRGLWREAERASRDRGYPLLLRNATIALCKEGFRDSCQVQRSCHEVHAVLLNILMREALQCRNSPGRSICPAPRPGLPGSVQSPAGAAHAAAERRSLPAAGLCPAAGDPPLLPYRRALLPPSACKRPRLGDSALAQNGSLLMMVNSSATHLGMCRKIQRSPHETARARRLAVLHVKHWQHPVLSMKGRPLGRPTLDNTGRPDNLQTSTALVSSRPSSLACAQFCTANACLPRFVKVAAAASTFGDTCDLAHLGCCWCGYHAAAAP